MRCAAAAFYSDKIWGGGLYWRPCILWFNFKIRKFLTDKIKSFSKSLAKKKRVDQPQMQIIQKRES